MLIRLTSLASAFLASAVVLASCTHTTTHSGESAAAVQTFDDPEALIWAVTAMGGTKATRLHPDYIWNTLHARTDDEKVNAAFDLALTQGTDESMHALIRALELKFIHDPATSSLDLMGNELSEHFRKFDWQPTDYPGGPPGPNEDLADIMVDALDVVSPERRVNRSRTAVILKSEATEPVWQYMEAEWVPIPGVDRWKLNRHACESFVRMREQAKAEGVDLIIRSANRLRSTAEANAARVNNPAAVASFSAHSLGLAIDFEMSQADKQFAEVTTSPMSEVIRMRESPVHKWLHLRGNEFGWYPYQNEPWHWEYNPPGFRDIYFTNFPGGAPVRSDVPND